MRFRRASHLIMLAALGIVGCGSPTVDEEAVDCPEVIYVGEGSDPASFYTFDLLLGIDVIYEAFAAGEKFVMIDARPPSDYKLHHVKGAISLPYYDVEKCVNNLPKDAWYITYCACPHNESEYAANVLLNNGFEKAKVLDEGYIIWRECGYPTSDFPDGNPNASCEEDDGEGGDDSSNTSTTD